MKNQITPTEIKVAKSARRDMLIMFLLTIVCSVFIFAKTFEYNPVPRAYTIVTRTFNTAYIPSATRDIMASYSLNITSTLSLAGGQSGTINLQISKDNGAVDPYKTVATATNNNTGTLTVGLNTSQSQTTCLAAFIPQGYYVKLVTSGTSTFSYVSGQELQL